MSKKRLIGQLMIVLFFVAFFGSIVYVTGWISVVVLTVSIVATGWVVLAVFLATSE